MNGTCSQAHGVLRRAKHTYHPRSGQRLMTADGTLTTSYLEERMAFRTHFCALFKGEVMSFATLADEERRLSPPECAVSSELLIN